MEWTFEEDYIICCFCEDHKEWIIADKKLDELIEKLHGEGFASRSKAAVQRRAKDCQNLLCGWEAPYASVLLKERCNAFVHRTLDRERCSDLRFFLNEHYDNLDGPEAITAVPQSAVAYVPIDPVGPTFQEMLFHFIDRSTGKDSEIYKRAQIGRDTFSKIRSGKKGVSKKTIKQLCFGLKLTYDEAVSFMAAAGYAFSNNDIGDLVVVYFLKHKMYDTYEVNAELYERNQELLFSGRTAYSQ